MNDYDEDDCDDDDLEPDYDDDQDSLFDSVCCLGADCLNPHPYHFAYECFDEEMAEAAMSGDVP